MKSVNLLQAPPENQLHSLQSLKKVCTRWQIGAPWLIRQSALNKLQHNAPHRYVAFTIKFFFFLPTQ